jgi:hypothetical protein
VYRPSDGALPSKFDPLNPCFPDTHSSIGEQYGAHRASIDHQALHTKRLARIPAGPLKTKSPAMDIDLLYQIIARLIASQLSRSVSRDQIPLKHSLDS